MAQPSAKARELGARITDYVWRRDLGQASWPAAVAFHTLRILFVVARDLRDGQLNLRAMGLVYTTLLSMVPLLAISFSVLKGFGVHNQIAPMLFTLVEPLGDKGAEIAERIIEFVEGLKVGVLGSVGIVLLLYTVLSVMQKIERALNHIWHVRRPRPLAQRFSDYLSVILIGPVLIFASTGISATAMNNALVRELAANPAIGFLVNTGAVLVPLLLGVAAFTFIYMFIPNTRVKLSSALIGAFTAAILWKAAGWVFASFVVTSTRYEAIYSAFATLIFFMIWLYVSWLVLMIGAAVAFYHQRPEHLILQHDERGLSNRVKEKIALLAMQHVAERLYRDEDAPTLEEIASHVRAPVEATQAVVEALEEADLLIRAGEGEALFLPARPLDTTEAGAVLDAVRAAEEDSFVKLDRLAHEPRVDAVIVELDSAARKSLSGLTLKDLALGAPADAALRAAPQAIPLEPRAHS